ncbi:MAG: alpha-L-fucosidase [Pseudoflavonifractor sp.]|nr:alpha-L-fucosidase [Alloprevotella sp.]MCM1117478.1 alpha-L-fucosidase [Pseudoflavonifractor sp.]
MNIKILISLAAALTAMTAGATLPLVDETPANPDNEPRPVFPLPSERQLLWNETEFYAFFHFGMNTFTGREWGNGDEDETLYAPTEKPDPEQWLSACKAAGMKGGIAVVKHHDGFCLWPTATTDHNVTRAGTEGGRQTNIPRDFVAAAEKLGMKYGFYISPWDRNSAYWGDGTTRYVDEVFIPQCREIAQYGNEHFEMWFDGATGGGGYYGGLGGNRAIDASIYYNWPNLSQVIHSIAPNCVMWGAAGEARWIGNEAGWAGETCWSGGSGTSGDENAWHWTPGESDAKATRGGWFWHSDDDARTLDELWKFYLETVGRNATLILNFPPNQTGKLPKQYVGRLAEFGQRLNERLGTDLAPLAKVEASETRANGANRTYTPSNMTDGDKDTYWAPEDTTTTATITLTWDEPQNLHYIALQEYIRLGQRVKDFSIETSANGVDWEKRGTGNMTTVGYKRIIPLNGKTDDYGDGYECKAVRISVNDAKGCPLFHTISAF